MDRLSLQRDLARLTAGEVFTDPVSREVYATAACLYRIVPSAVVCPAGAEEVAAIMAYARDRGLPVTARGAGSGVAGQALGSGIVIDFAAHLNRLLTVDPEQRQAVVQPGLILSRLNRELAGYGLRFPPDPSSADYATLGGMIANNSSGPHSMKCGDTRAWTVALKVVFADGSHERTQERPIALAKEPEPSTLPDVIHSRLPDLLEKYAPAIERSRPRVKKNSSGYHVWDLVRDGRLNLTPLLVGSEGTLALVTEARLKLEPVPAGRSAALVTASTLDQACAGVDALLPLEPAAIEIMDHLFAATVREHRPDLRHLLPASAQVLLLVEFEAEDSDRAAELLDRAGRALRELPGPELVFTEARSRGEMNQLWEIRKAASPILYRLPGKRLTRFIEDLVIPRDRLAEGIGKIQQILARHGTEAPMLGHAGSGNLHLNPRLDLADPADRVRMQRIADEIYELVIGMGGSISGEHGDGILRAPYVGRQFPELVPLFREIKDLFDPQGIMNPGKKLREPGSIPLESLFIKTGTPAVSPAPSLRRRDLMEMILRCHGCGLCRTYCPVADALGSELSLPRSKLSLLRAVAQGDLALEEPEVKDGLLRALDLCTFCQRCVTGCPTGIEPATVIRAFLDDVYSRRGRPLREKLFANAPRLLAAGSLLPRPAAGLLANPAVRSLAERVLAINPRAPWPRPSGDAVKNLRPRRASAAGKQVVYYPGCLGRYSDGEGETRAALEVLEALGYRPILGGLPCCGAPRLAVSDQAGARRAAQNLAAGLQKYLARELPVITACPTCALVIKHEYRELIPGDFANIAPRVHEFFAFLDEGHPQARTAPPAAPLDPAVLHRSCHHAGLESQDRVAGVLARMAGLSLPRADDACCGLAGCFGMRIENAPVMEALGNRLIAAAQSARTTRVISSCPSCRMQIRALGLKPVSAVVLLARRLRGEEGWPRDEGDR